MIHVRQITTIWFATNRP